LDFTEQVTLDHERVKLRHSQIGLDAAQDHGAAHGRADAKTACPRWQRASPHGPHGSANRRAKAIDAMSRR